MPKLSSILLLLCVLPTTLTLIAPLPSSRRASSPRLQAIDEDSLQAKLASMKKRRKAGRKLSDTKPADAAEAALPEPLPLETDAPMAGEPAWLDP